MITAEDGPPEEELASMTGIIEEEEFPCKAESPDKEEDLLDYEDQLEVVESCMLYDTTRTEFPLWDHSKVPALLRTYERGIVSICVTLLPCCVA